MSLLEKEIYNRISCVVTSKIDVTENSKKTDPNLALTVGKGGEQYNVESHGIVCLGAEFNNFGESKECIDILKRELDSQFKQKGLIELSLKRLFDY